MRCAAKRTPRAGGRKIARNTRCSCRPPFVQFLALAADLALQLVEERGVPLADEIDEAGDEQVARGLRAGEEGGQKIAGLLAFPFGFGEAGRVEEGALGLAPV